MLHKIYNKGRSVDLRLIVSIIHKKMNQLKIFHLFPFYEIKNSDCLILLCLMHYARFCAPVFSFSNGAFQQKTYIVKKTELKMIELICECVLISLKITFEHTPTLLANRVEKCN